MLAINEHILREALTCTFEAWKGACVSTGEPQPLVLETGLYPSSLH